MGRLSDEWKYDELRPLPAKDREKAAKRIASMPYEEAVKEMEKLHSEFNINDVNDISRRIMDKTKGDPDNYGKKLDHEIVNDKNIDAAKDSFTPPGAEEVVKEEIDTNGNGEIEVDEMADFQKSLDDYAAKNKKGREDVPATYKR
jgi:hypothetical protein